MKTDRLTIQMVVIFIGAACLLSIGGLIVLSFTGRPVPEPLTTLGATAIGALGSMLARTSTEVTLRGATTSAHSLPDDPTPRDLTSLGPTDTPTIPTASSPEVTSIMGAKGEVKAPEAEGGD